VANKKVLAPLAQLFFIITLSSMDKIVEFNNILKSLNIQANCVDHQLIDNYFYYDIKLHPHTRIQELKKRTEELCLILRVPCKPQIKAIYEKGIVRMEFINSEKGYSLNLLEYFTNKDVLEGDLPCLLGRSISGKRMWMDLSQNPHMIVAGTTGSGKSTLLHNIIANLLNYSNAYLYLIDPKNIEFAGYEKDIKSRVKVSYTYNQAMNTVDHLIRTMEARFEMLRKGLNPSLLPYIVVIVDEFADLIMQDKEKQFHDKLCELARKCRAARMSLILATQRPSVNIISGSIKANFPARIACRVASNVDSRIILDASGAENLFGQGDALLKDNFRFMERFQVAYTNTNEVCKYFGNIND